MRNARAGVVPVIALTALLALLAGCSVAVRGTATPARGGSVALAPARYVDGQRRFSIVPPQGWRPDTSGRESTAVFFLASDPDTAAAGPFVSNINVLVLPAHADLDATVGAARGELAGLNAYRLLDDEAATLAGGLPAHVLGGTFTQSGFALRNLQLFTVYQGSTVVVTGTALADRWAGYGALVDASLHTVIVPAPA